MDESGSFHTQTAGSSVLSGNKHVRRRIRVNEPVEELQESPQSPEDTGHVAVNKLTKIY